MVFQGNETEARAFLTSAQATAYVYILRRPCGTPFYVGEGGSWRVFDHALEARRAHRRIEQNPYKCNVIRKVEAEGAQIIYEIESLHLRKPDARRREGELILQLGRAHEGGPLSNLAGGHGNPDQVAPQSREKHQKSLSGEAGHPETRALNLFFQSIATVKSVPIKSLKVFRKRVRHTTMETKPDAFSARNAGAIVASAVCHGLRLEAGAEIPRLFVYDGIDAIIENGVCENITGRGIARVAPVDDPFQEKIVLSPSAVKLIRNLIGPAKLEILGVVS